MGTFIGHVIPGSFLVLIALWWIIQSFRRYFQSLLPNTPPFKSTLTFPTSCFCGPCRSIELEGLVKFLMCVVGISGEIATAFKDGQFRYLGNGQHAIMFFFFGLSGVVDILIHHRLPLPPGMEYSALILAFSVEAVLFNFHLHQRSSLDIAVHRLLILTVYAAIVALALEMKHRHQPLAVFTRAWCTLVQGSWFIHLGFILYNPLPDSVVWDGEDQENVLLCSMMFACHLAGAVFCMLVLGTLIGWRYRCRGEFKTPSSYDPLQMKLLKRDANGQTIVNLNDDDLSESDTEFERIISTRKK